MASSGVGSTRPPAPVSNDARRQTSVSAGRSRQGCRIPRRTGAARWRTITSVLLCGGLAAGPMGGCWRCRANCRGVRRAGRRAVSAALATSGRGRVLVDVSGLRVTWPGSRLVLFGVDAALATSLPTQRVSETGAARDRRDHRPTASGPAPAGPRPAPRPGAATLGEATGAQLRVKTGKRSRFCRSAVMGCWTITQTRYSDEQKV